MGIVYLNVDFYKVWYFKLKWLFYVGVVGSVLFIVKFNRWCLFLWRRVFGICVYVFGVFDLVYVKCIRVWF